MTSISDTEVVNAPGGLVELGYSQITSAVTVDNATAGTGKEIVAPITVVCDGSPVLVEFFSQNVYISAPNVGDTLDIALWVDGAEQDRFWARKQSVSTNSASEYVYTSRRIVPAAGSHTFAVRGVSTATARPWIVNAGAGGTAAAAPAFLRVSKIIQASQLLVTQSNAPIVTSLPVGNLVTGQEVDLYVTTPYAGYQRYKWNGTAWYVIGDSRAQGVWQSFTPTLTQSSNVTFNVNYAKYVIFGKTVMVNFNLSPTSSGILNNNILFGFGSGSTALPTAASASGIHGNFRWFDVGVSNWVGTICGSNTTSVFFTNDGNGNNAGFSGTLTNGDIIEGSFFYEMA